MKFAITTLGCKVNQYDSERIREALLLLGYEEQSFQEPGADLYIINTCTVTHRSDAQNRKLIRRALNQGGRVIVTGCQAVVFANDLEVVSGRLEVATLAQLEGLLGLDLSASISGFAGHARAFVKVQQGCNNYCTYCIVPYTRGEPVTRDLMEIVAEINQLQAAGYSEVILTGINIGLYDGGLTGLLEEVLKRTGMPRIRISSVEPWTVDEQFIELLAGEARICKHLHLPLQSGSDRILQAMHRPYERSYYASLVEKVRNASAEIAIGTDLMVGFPGESDEIFRDSAAFIESLPLTYMHVFPYSKRSGTPAAELPGQVDEELKKQRAAELRAISAIKREGFVKGQLGRRQEVLVTEVDEKSFIGVTGNYLRVKVVGQASWGSLQSVVLSEYRGGVVVGRADAD